MGEHKGQERVKTLMRMTDGEEAEGGDAMCC